MKRLILTLALALACLLPVSAHAASLAEQRSAVQDMRRDTLTKLYRAQPGTDAEVRNAAGYAVFSSADIAAIFVSGTFGHGIAHDNRANRETYMQMASAGVGLGIGVKDFRTIFVFNDPAAYDDFVNTGLDLSGHVDVAAKQGVNGGDITGAVDILPGVRVYQLTDTGLLAQVMLKGTKYWKDSELNDYEQHSQADPSYGYNP